MLFKETDAVITPSLTNLFNLSIRTGFFLRDRKLAKVTPIYIDWLIFKINDRLVGLRDWCWKTYQELLICCSISERFCLQYKAFDLFNNMRYYFWVMGLLKTCDVTNNGRHLWFYQKEEIRFEKIAVFLSLIWKNNTNKHFTVNFQAVRSTLQISICPLGIFLVIRCWPGSGHNSSAAFSIAVPSS